MKFMWNCVKMGLMVIIGITIIKVILGVITFVAIASIG